MLYHTPQVSSTPGKPVVPQIPLKTANGKPAQSQGSCCQFKLSLLVEKIWPTESRSPRKYPELTFHTNPKLSLWQ